MKEKRTATRKLGKLFYIILIALTAVMLTMLSLWTVTEKPLYLYLLLGIFPVYVFHLVFHLEFLAAVRDENAKVVYMTYLGNERRVKKPSQTKKDYFVEFYSAGVDTELLKRHLWFDLSEADEETLLRSRIGQLEIPFPFLSEISGRTLLVQEAFFRAAEHSPLFAPLFRDNEVILYGE